MIQQLKTCRRLEKVWNDSAVACDMTLIKDRNKNKIYNFKEFEL